MSNTEAEEDFNKRAGEFLKEYKALTEKYDVDFANYPEFIPNKERKFDITVKSIPVDLKLFRLNQSFLAK